MNQPNEYVSILTELLLAKSMLEWRENPDMSLRRIFRLNFNKSISANKNLPSRDLLDLAIINSLSNLVRQTFVSNYEYLRHNIDDKMSAKLKNLRNETSSGPNNLNTSKFMDAIRQSLVHNDITQETPNWKLVDNFQIEINFKGNSFTFDLFQFHTIMNEFLALKQEHFYTNFDVAQNDIGQALFKQRLTPKNIKQYVTIYKTGNKQEKDTLDQYQCSALVNLFSDETKLISTARLLMLAPNNYFIMQKLFPSKHNAGHISYLNNLCFRSLIKLRNNYLVRQDFLDASDEFEYNVELLDEHNTSAARCSLLNFVQTEIIAFEATLLSNALFTMFSIATPTNISSLLDEYNIDANRLRNSLMHGRYFHDCNMGFEFYDGRNNDNLEHIGTLSVNDIYKIVGKFVENNLQSEDVHSI